MPNRRRLYPHFDREVAEPEEREVFEEYFDEDSIDEQDSPDERTLQGPTSQGPAVAKKIKRLLDAPETNIGRQKLVVADVAAAVGDAGRGREVSLLDLHGDSQVGQVVTVVFAAYDPTNVQDGNTLATHPGIPVGIVRFGNGAGLAEVEVDIPNPFSHVVDGGVQHASNGVCLSVPAGNLRVSARDDGRVKPGTGQAAPVPDGTAGGQLISAHVVYGHRGSPSKLYRTLFFAFNSLAALGFVTLRVPSFARAVKFYRQAQRALTIDFLLNWPAAAVTLDSLSVAANAASSEYLLPPRTSAIKITNADAANTITTGMAVFEIAL
jgi:hypothetical protein